MRYFVSATLIIVGVIHLLPLIGVAGGSRLATLYGISVADPNLEILLRHRAVLFGIVGAFLTYAAFRVELQALALIAAFVSLAAFLALVWSTGNYNSAIGGVALVDVLALVLVVAAGVAHVVSDGRWPNRFD